MREHSARSPFGRKVAALRKVHGLDSRQFADKIGYSKQFQSNIECGQRPPSIRYVEAILETFPNEMRADWHRAAAVQIGWEV